MTLNAGVRVERTTADAIAGGVATRLAIPVAQRWLVLVFYASDFSPVSASELAAIGALHAAFEANGADVAAAGPDDVARHASWLASDPGLSTVEFPVIADTDRVLARAFEALDPDGNVVPATFVLDDDGVVRHATCTAPGVARNFTETLRTLRALRTGMPCPADWDPSADPAIALASAFPALPPEALRDAAMLASRVTVAAGEVIVREGSSADGFYVVLRGSVEVVRGGVRIASLGPGEFFGEVGLLTDMPRNASVLASEDAELVTLDGEAFHRLVDATTPAAPRVAREARRRMQPD